MRGLQIAVVGFLVSLPLWAALQPEFGECPTRLLDIPEKKFSKIVESSYRKHIEAALYNGSLSRLELGALYSKPFVILPGVPTNAWAKERAAVASAVERLSGLIGFQLGASLAEASVFRMREVLKGLGALETPETPLGSPGKLLARGMRYNAGSNSNSNHELAFKSDSSGSMLAVDVGNGLEIWKVNPTALVSRIKVRLSGRMNETSFTPDGRHLVSADRDRFEVWKVETSERLALIGISDFFRDDKMGSDDWVRVTGVHFANGKAVLSLRWKNGRGIDNSLEADLTDPSHPVLSRIPLQPKQSEPRLYVAQDFTEYIRQDDQPDRLITFPASFDRHGKRAAGIAFAPNGRSALVTNVGDILLWKADGSFEGSFRSTLPNSKSVHARFTADSSRLIVAGIEMGALGVIEVWELSAP